MRNARSVPSRDPRAGARRRRVVLISRTARLGRPALAALEEQGFEVVERFDVDGTKNEDALGAALEDAWASVAGSEAYTRRVLERAASLQAIARCGVGYDAVDVAAATELGVAVLTTPGSNSDAVADFALALMLASLRRVTVLDRTVRDGGWRPTDASGDLSLANVGIVGLGSIGLAVARRLQGFGCRLLGVEPNPRREVGELGIELLSLAELLPVVDVLSLHAPLSDATRHLIGRHELALIKPGAVLVNTARGDLVDSDALVTALRDGRLAGAGLDVFEREPLPKDHPLMTLPNVVLSGHAASFSRLGIANTIAAVTANLLDVAAGSLPPGCVNPTISLEQRSIDA